MDENKGKKLKKRIQTIMKLDVDPEKLDKYKQIFDSIGNNKADITIKDVYKYMKAMGNTMNINQIKSMFENKKTLTSGKISFIEFVSFIKDIETLDEDSNINPNDILKAFEVFDKEKSGYIDISQLKLILINLGKQFKEEDYNNFIIESGIKNNETKCNYKQLVKMWDLSNS